MRVLIVTMVVLVAVGLSQPVLAASYEDGIRELSESIVTEVARARKSVLAVADFTDLKGNVTPLGRFLAEELSVSLALSREVQVLDRNELAQILRKHAVASLKALNAETIKKIGEATGIQGLVIGTITEMTAATLHVTAKVIATDTAKVISAARAPIAKAGPIVELLKQQAGNPAAPKAPPSKPVTPPTPDLPSYSSDLYRMTIAAANRTENTVVLDLLVENLSSKHLRVSCLIRETYLRDETGVEWRQDVEQNREGICVRGLTLMPASKQRTTMEFTATGPNSGKVLSLRYHEAEPRRDFVFTINGIKVE